MGCGSSTQAGQVANPQGHTNGNGNGTTGGTAPEKQPIVQPPPQPVVERPPPEPVVKKEEPAPQPIVQQPPPQPVVTKPVVVETPPQPVVTTPPVVATPPAEPVAEKKTKDVTLNFSIGVRGFPILSGADPIVAVFAKKPMNDTYVLLGRTERTPASDAGDCDFKSKLTVTAHPNDTLRVGLFDMNDDGKIDDKDLVGESSVSVLTVASGTHCALSLRKNGAPVTGCSIVLNPNGDTKGLVPTPPPARITLPPIIPETEVSLFLGARNFPILSATDPLIAVFVKSKQHWYLVGKTEKQKNNTDPYFANKVNFRVRPLDQVRLALLEVEEESRLDENGLVGEAFVTGASLIEGKAQTLRLTTHDGRNVNDTVIFINPTQLTIAELSGRGPSKPKKKATPVEKKELPNGGIQYTFQASVRGFPILSRGRPMVAFFDIVEKKDGDEQKAGVVGHEYKQVGKTELAHGHDADFTAKLTIDTVPTAPLVRLGLFDLDNDGDLDDKDLVGDARIQVADIASGKTVIVPLKRHGRRIVECFVHINPRIIALS